MHGLNEPCKLRAKNMNNLNETNFYSTLPHHFLDETLTHIQQFQFEPNGVKIDSFVVVQSLMQAYKFYYKVHH